MAADRAYAFLKTLGIEKISLKRSKKARYWECSLQDKLRIELTCQSHGGPSVTEVQTATSFPLFESASMRLPPQTEMSCSVSVRRSLLVGHPKESTQKKELG